MRKTSMLVLVSIALSCALVAPSAHAGFGVNDFDLTFTGADGSPATQAGSHPFAMTTTFDFNTIEKGVEVFTDLAPRDVIVNLPAGFVGDPIATPRCSNADFEDINTAVGLPSCSNSTAVGTIALRLGVPGKEPVEVVVPVYNLTPPPGRVTKFGFVVLNVPVTLEVGINPDPPYNVIAYVDGISQALDFFGSRLTLWGDPADPAHDPYRGSCVNNSIPIKTPGEIISTGSCPANARELPFLTLPTACTGPLTTTYEADPWEQPQAWVYGSSETHDNSNPPSPLGMTGCSRVAFAPTIDAQPTTVSTESPTGLDFTLDVHDEGLTNPVGVAQSDIKKVVVVLPESMSVNPALAEGLTACSVSDLANETIDSQPGEGCPAESKIGTVEVQTPVLEQTLMGSLYLARQNENPFGSLLALYVVVKDPETGILLKLAGKVEPNPTTGQLVSVFDKLPQLPFSHFRLSFRQGQRSPLVTPPLCGTYTTQAELTPWANPNTVAYQTATFQVRSGIGGGPCPSGGAAPFKPGLLAGTLNNSAGSYSPIDIQITRNDGEQEITGFSSLLPPGVTANLNGVPFCSPAQIAASERQSGAEEEDNPSCPLASEIGHTLVGVGVGSVLAYTPGKLYMAGPLDGAPFSVVAITSAKVGPFDLGTVVVHLPLNIDPLTAQVSIPAGAADQIPHILDGIVVHVRDIRVYVDRPSFTLNPTECQPLALSATVYGAGQNLASPADDVSSTVSDRFQAANCANLQFKPTFKASSSGKTSRARGASLHVSLTFPKDALGRDANIRSVKVDLPKQLPSRLPTLQKACTTEQFTSNPAGCPAASRVGMAKALTPILPVPLEGPAYFVSYGGAKFPELVIVLQGYGVTIDLHGETFIDGRTDVTSSTFRAVPDQPVESFELTLPQGTYSALAAPAGLCNITKTKLVKRKVTVRSKGAAKRTVTRTIKETVSAALTMPTAFTAQNGVVVHQNTPIEVTGCPRHKATKVKTSRDAHSR